MQFIAETFFNKEPDTIKWIKDYNEWLIYRKTKRPKNIPTAPNYIYRKKGWKDFKDFLGFQKLQSRDHLGVHNMREYTVFV